MSATPPDQLLLHLSDALATDPRVQELGLTARLDGPDGDRVVVVEGNVSSAARRAAVIEVVRELLDTAGWAVDVENRTTVTRPVPPSGPAEVV